MKTADKLLHMLTGAINEEETELAKNNPGGQRSDVESVRQYEEAWLQHVILRHAMENRLFERVNCELSQGCTRADFSFEDANRNPVAILELKMGRVGKTLADQLETDYEKQHRQFSGDPRKTERFVAVLANGGPEEVQQWLKGRYTTALNHLNTQPLSKSETWLKSNLDNEQLVLILLQVGESAPAPHQ